MEYDLHIYLYINSLGNRMLSEKMTTDGAVDFSIDPKHEVGFGIH